MKRKKDKKRLTGWIVALAVVLCMAGFMGYMALNACTLHLRRAIVQLEDLPAEFEGKTILYAADIDLGGINTAERAADVFDRLQVLNPDILLLGGDYTSPTLADLLNQSETVHYAANTSNVRQDFFHYIKGFHAPLGKYMIASPDDTDEVALWSLALETGFKPLNSEVVEVSISNERLWIAGLGKDTSAVSKLASRFNKSDCVVAMTWSPNQFPSLMTSEAADSGHWIDMTLSGHTHGGQINAFGKSILSLDALEQQYTYGWSRETGVPMLVTSGMGCEGVNLRLGSHSEVWLITLTGIQGE